MLLMLVCLRTIPSIAPQSNEITHVLSKYERTSNHLAGIALSTSAVFTPNVPIPIPGLLRGNITPLTDHFDQNLDLLYYGGQDRDSRAEPDRTDQHRSADLWVPVDCPRCPGAQLKPGHSRTYESRGGTFEEHYVRPLDLSAQRRILIEFKQGRGRVSVAVASDVFSISGLSVQDQDFGTATEKSGEFSRDSNNELL